jgi:hypothetical protein
MNIQPKRIQPLSEPETVWERQENKHPTSILSFLPSFSRAIHQPCCLLSGTKVSLFNGPGHAPGPKVDSFCGHEAYNFRAPPQKKTTKKYKTNCKIKYFFKMRR